LPVTLDVVTSPESLHIVEHFVFPLTVGRVLVLVHLYAFGRWPTEQEHIIYIYAAQFTPWLILHA